MDEICPQKGVEHALDHIGDSFDFVASGIAHWLHDGWGHSHPAGHRRHRVSGPTYSGKENIVAIWTLAGGKVRYLEKRCSAGPEGFCRILQDLQQKRSRNEPFHNQI